jgi:virulence factor Mce-like protein
MRRRLPSEPGRLTHPKVVGWVLVVVALVAVYLAYNASRGLPVAPHYTIRADVPDAAELNRRTSEVRIGGSRVGLVTEVEAMPARGNKPPFARLTLDLEKDLERIPVDSLVQVRPRSILGAKYLDLQVGSSSRGVAPGGVLPIGQARSAAEFDEAFEVFDRDTTRGIRGTLTELGGGLAGRGTAMNDSLASLHTLLPRLERVARALAAPSTELGGFVHGFATTSRALARVAPQLGSLIAGAATTFAALDAGGAALTRSIEALPGTEDTATRAFIHLSPVLDDATAIVVAIRPGVRALPRASRRLARALVAGTPLLRDLNAPLGRPAVALLRSLRALAVEPATANAVSELTTTVTTLRTTLETLGPAQITCNVAGLWMRNVGDTLRSGDASGYWLNVLPVFDLTGGQMLQSAAPDRNLHINHHPLMDTSECEAGNEPYRQGQLIGNPPGKQPNRTEETAPPSDSRERARRAGLLEGTRP